MASLNKKLAYLRDRMVNAWRMIREGRFHVFTKSIFQELRTRREAIENRYRGRSRLLNSRFYNSRKVTPASYRPTDSVLLSDQVSPLDGQRISASLLRLRNSIKLSDGIDG